MAVTRRGTAPVVVSFVITIDGAAVVAVSCSREPLLVARLAVPRVKILKLSTPAAEPD
jgi:hypothetical protein